MTKRLSGNSGETLIPNPKPVLVNFKPNLSALFVGTAGDSKQDVLICESSQSQKAMPLLGPVVWRISVQGLGIQGSLGLQVYTKYLNRALKFMIGIYIGLFGA